MSEHEHHAPTLDRRAFVKTSAALAALPLAAPAARARLARTAHAGGSDALRLGVVGCGGRGTGAAIQALRADRGVRLVGMADAFEDRARGSLEHVRQTLETMASDPESPLDLRDQLALDEDSLFIGLDAYERLIAAGLDVVILATPPCFRPVHLAAAVAAGLHVFCEKPVAVDAPGVRSVLASARRAREQRLSLVSGLCWRRSSPERALFGRVDEGAIGDVRAVYTTYLAGTLWYHDRQSEWTDMQHAVRNWYYRTWASGDHIVEQAVHSLDKMAWAFGDRVPQRCTAVGGRQVRTEERFGDVFDHFTATFEYEGGAKGFHVARQMANCAWDNSDHVLGTKGTCDVNGWAPRHVIAGEHAWDYADVARELRRRGVDPRPNMYQVEHDELFAAIRADEPVNDGEWMANSTMLAILARMSAYTGQTLTWEQALASEQDLTPPAWRPREDGTRVWSWDVEPPPLVVATPGVTEFQ